MQSLLSGVRLYVYLQFIGLVGRVHRITDRGDVRVQYEGCSNRWTFHPGALKKVCIQYGGCSNKWTFNVYFLKKYPSEILSSNTHMQVKRTQNYEYKICHLEWPIRCAISWARFAPISAFYFEVNLGSTFNLFIFINIHPKSMK